MVIEYFCAHSSHIDSPKHHRWITGIRGSPPATSATLSFSIKYSNESPKRTETQPGESSLAPTTSPSSLVAIQRILSPILMLIVFLPQRCFKEPVRRWADRREKCFSL